MRFPPSRLRPSALPMSAAEGDWGGVVGTGGGGGDGPGEGQGLGAGGGLGLGGGEGGGAKMTSCEITTSGNLCSSTLRSEDRVAMLVTAVSLSRYSFASLRVSARMTAVACTCVLVTLSVVSRIYAAGSSRSRWRSSKKTVGMRRMGGLRRFEAAARGAFEAARGAFGTLLEG